MDRSDVYEIAPIYGVSFIPDNSSSEMESLLELQADILQGLVDIETQILESETDYLESTTGCNMVRGWETFFDRLVRWSEGKRIGRMKWILTYLFFHITQTIDSVDR